MKDVKILVANVLDMIQTPSVRKLADEIIGALPKYWWTAPASTSGQFHPVFAKNGANPDDFPGGLVRHSVIVALEAGRFAYAEGASQRYIDRMIVAGLVHDGLKQGWPSENDDGGKPGHTVHEHPLLMAELLRTRWAGNRDAEWIASVVETHMGKFTTSRHSDVVLPKPRNRWQRMLSHADMCAADAGWTWHEFLGERPEDMCHPVMAAATT